VGGAPLAAARRFRIRHRGESRASAMLLAAWLGERLGWEPVGATWRERRSVRRLTFRRGDLDATVDVDLVSDGGGECGTSGIIELAMWPDGAGAGDAGDSGGIEPAYAVCRTRYNHAELLVPIAPPRIVKLDSRTDAELCAVALGPRGRDPLLRHIFAYAGRLAALAAQGGE
jgi:hypothetical protein